MSRILLINGCTAFLKNDDGEHQEMDREDIVDYLGGLNFKKILEMSSCFHA